MSAIHVFSGGIENGDYAGLQVAHLANAGWETANWGGCKHAEIGDRVLLYMQLPVSSLFASGIVCGKPFACDPSESKYKWRVPLNYIRLLPKYLPREVILRDFPAAEWFLRPQGKVNLTKCYPKLAELLWKTAKGGQS